MMTQSELSPENKYDFPLLPLEYTDLTPNQTDKPKIRLRKAHQWLLENPDETLTTAAKIFDLVRLTLSNHIHRQKKLLGQRGGHNKILTEAHDRQVHYFKHWLEHNQLPTRAVIFKEESNGAGRGGSTALVS